MRQPLVSPESRTAASTRNLWVRYLFAFVFIAALIIIGQILLQAAQERLSSIFETVNVAGRANTYSQRLSKAAVMIEFAQTPDELYSGYAEIETAIQTWQAMNERLINGLDDITLPAEQLSIIRRSFDEIAPSIAAMDSAAQCMRAWAVEGRSLERARCPLSMTEYREIISTNEREYLRLMDLIQFQYTRGAEADYAQIRNAQNIISAIILTVLILVSLFIIRPAVSRIGNIIKRLTKAESELRSVNEMLEARVRERTMALEHANVQLAAANDDILNFTSIVSHDLRSPIVSARGFLKEITLDLRTIKPAINVHELTPNAKEIRYALDYGIPESLESLDMAVSQMERLTKGVLRINRDKKREYAMTVIDTHEMVGSILTSLMLPLREKDATARVIARLPYVTTDSLALEQIFTNIISNAIKYLDPTRKGLIFISSESNDQRTIFHIRDNGRGIREQDYEKVFKPFRRAGDNRNIDGEGLGLYGIRTIILRLGGDIWFTSKVGVGSTFSFSLPTQPAHEPKDAERDLTQEAATSAAG
ncbi:MAG: HAMP domain-containing sensor histidine kinase [Chloroflexota bacterium]|nr:HAMP domain-containing sensor histidine kinase [Chloroflexota bacterium]